MGKFKRIALLLAGAAGAKVASKGYSVVKGLFDSNSKRAQENLIGQICEITTMTVTDSFGQAIFDDGAGGWIIQVRCAAENTFTRDSEVLIVSYDKEENTYDIESI